jgi:hypothetical protein
MAAVSTSPSYGVVHVHQDMRSHNIPISPTRIALLDFGEATLGNEGMRDDEWDAIVQNAVEVQGLRLATAHQSIADLRVQFSPQCFSGFQCSCSSILGRMEKAVVQ